MPRKHWASYHMISVYISDKHRNLVNAIQTARNKSGDPDQHVYKQTVIRQALDVGLEEQRKTYIPDYQPEGEPE